MNKNENNNESSTKNSDQIKSDILNYLEDKYNEEFTIISIQGKEFLEPLNVAKVFVYPTKGDKERDRFQAERTMTDGKASFADSYFGLLIRDEYNERISSVVSKYFDRFAVDSSFGNSTYFSNEYDETKSLQDAIDGGQDIFSNVNILVAPTCTEDEFNKNVENISNEIGNLKLPMGVGIYYSKSDDLSSLYTNNIECSIGRSLRVNRELNVTLDEEINYYK